MVLRAELQWVAAAAAVLLVAACAAAPDSGGNAAAPVPGAAAERVLVPAGYGTLRQDEVTVSLRSGPVQVKITPLDESVIRLLAPDTYQRLGALAGSRREEAGRGMMRAPELFMVSFHSTQPDMTFQPEDVQLFHQARLLRPASIMALTTGWGQQRLGQQETQTAIFAYEGPIDYTQPLRVRYAQAESDEWAQILSRLETERARVLSRAGG